MDRFENKVIRGIHVSRYVASWYKSGGTSKWVWNEAHDDLEDHIKQWLRTLIINGEHLTEEEIRYIAIFADNGKLELEESVKSFLKK